MSLEIIPTMFTPRQAEQITGVSVDQQRDWRRHGYLGKSEGHARFDAYEFARLLYMRGMAQRSIGPQVASQFADVCAIGIVYHAMAYPDAYSGNLDDLSKAGLVEHPELPEKFEADVRAAAKEMLGTDSDKHKEFLKALSPESILRSRQAHFLQRYISRFHSSHAQPANYFIIWADGSELWHSNIQEAFDDVSEHSDKMSGPVTILPLPSLGYQLVNRSQLPLFSFRVGAPSKVEFSRSDAARSPSREPGQMDPTPAVMRHNPGDGE